MPKIFIYISSLIGIILIFVTIFSFVSQNNNSQPQVNVIQEEEKKEINQKENKEEIQKEEEKKEPEKNEIEEEQEENKILKFLYIIMMIIFTLIGVVMIIISIISFFTGKEDDKALFKEAVFNIIFQISMLLCSFLIKGKMVSVITFIIQIIFTVCFWIFVNIKIKKIKKNKNN